MVACLSASSRSHGYSMKASPSHLLLVFALFVTMIVAMVPNYLPERAWQVFPDEDGWFGLFADEEMGGPSHSEWIDGKVGYWRCRVEEQGTFTYCGFNILTSENNRDGVDVSVYDAVRLKIRPLTEPQHLRLFMRHYDERYANPDDGNSPQFLQFSIRPQDLQDELVIEPSEFTVADWWIAQRAISRELAKPAFGNIIAIGLDYRGTLPPGDHEVVVEKLEFVGAWVSTENWYLGIIITWLLGALVVVTERMYRFRRTTRRARSRLQALASQHQDLRQEKNRYERLSSRDPLTGVYNRYGFEREAQKLLVQNERLEAALILMDIDHFKLINDTRGHNTGDDIIVGFTKLVAQHTRSEDILCRWGGEEFLLLCPGTHLDNAFALAEKIRKMVSETNFCPADPLQVTASFGVSQIGPDEEFLHALARADQALYQAKKQGRNCTVKADRLPNSPV